MKKARVSLSTFSCILGIAGMEHGIGEILQGNVSPNEIWISSWPNEPLYEILAGEPAITIVPNLLLTGILTVLVSLCLIVWAAIFLDKHKQGPIVVGLLYFLLLLVGGGVAPPIIGAIITLASIKLHKEISWFNTHLSPKQLGWIVKAWFPLYVLCIFSLFALWPGLVIASVFFVMPFFSVIILTFMAISSLILTILASFAYDNVKEDLV